MISIIFKNSFILELLIFFIELLKISNAASLISTKPDVSEENLIELIDKDEKLFKHINGKEIKRKIFIKNKLINIII